MHEFKIQRDESINKTIRMRKSLIDEMTLIADEHNISFNALVVQCCEYALKYLSDKNKAASDV